MRTFSKASRGLLRATLAIVCSISPVCAAATEVRTTPAAGIVHVHRYDDLSSSAPQDYHLVLIDLAATALEVGFTGEARRGSTTSSLAVAAGAVVAVNANFYDARRAPCGVAMSDGAFWASAYEGCPVTLAFGPGIVSFQNMEGRSRGPFPAPLTDSVRHAGSGKPRLLIDGESAAPFSNPDPMRTRQPRTAVGVTRDRQTLLLLVVDGRRPGAAGMSGEEIAMLLRSEGAWDAMNFDGGGSSALWIGAEGGIVNRPSDGAERAVANALVVVARPSPADAPAATAQ